MEGTDREREREMEGTDREREGERKRGIEREKQREADI